MLGWWIVPLGVFFGVYFGPKLSQWPRKAAVIRGILLGATLGLLTAIFFALDSRHSTPTRTIQTSFGSYPCIVPHGAEGIRGSGQSAFTLAPLMVAPQDCPP
jgi:hypothetical protein